MPLVTNHLVPALSALTCLALLPGCSTGDGQEKSHDTATITDSITDLMLEGMCVGEDPPNDAYFLREAYVTVDPGADCPDVDTVQLQVSGCDFDQWQGITCGFLRVVHDQVFINDGYGGYYANASTSDTEASSYFAPGPPVDICYYEGVFFNDPFVHTTC